MPRQQQPDAIRLAYYTALLPVIHRQTAPFRRIRGELVRLLEEANRFKRDHLDDDLDRKRRAHVLVTTAGRDAEELFREREVAQEAERYGKRTGTFQRGQLDRQVQASMGVPLAAVEKPTRDLIPSFVEENVALIKTVSERYHERVAAAVEEAFSTGQSVEEFAERLTDIGDISDDDALRIARDQVGRLNAKFNEARQQALGVTRFIWRDLNDGRVCEDCAALDGQEFSWSDPPADGPPGEHHVNDRCYAEPVLDEIIEDL
jgi:SPP1 gp7 family putative phage head morphogenesis protein